MLSYLRELYNDGQNDGDVKILCKDNLIIHCHTFVVTYASDTLKQFLKVKPNNSIYIEHNKKIVDIVFNFAYSEKIGDVDLDINEILSLFSLISYLRMNDFIFELKNYYARIFPDKLSIHNWLHVLKSIYGMEKYSDLLEVSIPYIKNIAIVDKNVKNILDTNNLDSDIKTFLLDIILDKVINLNDKLQSMIDHEQKEKKQQLNKLLIQSIDNCSDDDYNDLSDDFSDNSNNSCDSNKSSNKSNKKKKRNKKSVKKAIKH